MAEHEQSTFKHGEHLLLDQPLLRLPNELLRKNFRSAHFTIEKDTTALRALLRDAATSAASGRGAAPQADALRALDAMLGRMRGVRRKLAAHAREEERLHAQTAARIRHLDQLYDIPGVAGVTEDPRYEAWSRRRLDRLLADYLLRRGYGATAEQLARERDIEPLVDIETFRSMSKIREALLGGSIVEALAWCTENKKELRKMESKLEFLLRFQQYIELIRAQSQPKLIEAIAHAKKHLIPYWNTYPAEVKQAGGLLAFPPPSAPSSSSRHAHTHAHHRGASVSAYADLYSPARWAQLADVFTDAHNTLLGLPSAPLLHLALSSGLSALKTPACHHRQTTTTADRSGGKGKHSRHAAPPPATMGHGGVCPICSVELNDLARNVPYAHHTKSHVEHDLVLLPNGRVYGRQRLLEHSKKAGLPPQLFKDLLTGDVYPVESLKKVYIT
ncbi:CTLH, LisH motif protein [Cordyceps fumosorosea ARSEF 2679]|uniref:CTLH, LisH motif protein n=1 Tax=Cordyceps fumosorosea (strain ARSEF 2679) TaxID=1081104 RepID=A0A167RNB4_CORFA|nr:CTLH, LisH motif protein [Cordyceps fumosorosea ARSEF 2679]OAA58764.1 CTLH, LisH motif protein [Cordyceps fumosorosea ARSEF 2679]